MTAGIFSEIGAKPEPGRLSFMVSVPFSRFLSSLLPKDNVECC